MAGNDLFSTMLARQPQGPPGASTPPQPGLGMWSQSVPPTPRQQPQPGGPPPPPGGAPLPGPPAGMPPPPTPATMPQPPNPSPSVPPAVKRWDNAQQMSQAYANGWSPNPILLRILLGRH